MTLTLTAQDIAGDWHGMLKVQGVQLRLVFHIQEEGEGYTTTMDSPDQGAKGIPVTSTSFEHPTLKIGMPNLGIVYEGTLNEAGTITGDFNQYGQILPLELSREVPEKGTVLRPQEPVKPYPYYTEEVTFTNKKANVELAGTLSLPQQEGVFPTVVLISGSGPQNRDEELFGHRPFLVLADYLTKNGIAVLRYDDRGTALSTGNFNSATSRDFAEDVTAAVSFLKTRKEIDKNNIGLIGHSEGGIIAPMVASSSQDITFIVLMAGVGIPGDELLLLQQRAIGKVSGFSDDMLMDIEMANRTVFSMIKESTDLTQLSSDLTQYLKEHPDKSKPAGVEADTYAQLKVDQLLSPWWLNFIRYDPAIALEEVQCPVLAINGEKDLQVLPKQNLVAIKAALERGGNQKLTIKELPGLNHLFQESSTGSPAEYGQLSQTLAPEALDTILTWIQKQVRP
ncbi:alpha/beta hydrolase [Maribacter cobaltidurans]|uniref:Alpha/beta hydrolase n=1 Tax=Maribacter cobaltidurans TaxID=1178778 RepID=A0ABU7IQS9_9FLAO|nr:alpha/beta hydrolase [Maribacter cobaltidurans]MEE1975327.1 alpha/beta hydrolase [Maribacter cobaltidurans]